jgi:AcrR family transcriptional regulator
MQCPLAQMVRHRRKDARPGEIAAAALELFTEKGFAATRMDDIAARAGVSKGTIYLYFENKEALFKAAVEATMTPALEAAEALVAADGKPAAEMLRCFVFGWWEMVGSTTLGGVPKLLVAESQNFPELARWFHENMISRAHRAVVRIVEHGVARGEFRATEPLTAARIIFSPMFSFIVWRRAFAGCMVDLPEPEAYLNQAVDILVHGLAAREPAP